MALDELTSSGDASRKPHFLFEVLASARRLVAFIIDSVIVGVFTLVIAAIICIPFVLMAVATGLPWYLFNPFSFPFFAGIISVLYFTLLETYYGSTFGKKIMNLKTRKLDGQKPPLDSAFMRNISKIY